jgi:anti-sigma factor RsiW
MNCTRVVRALQPYVDGETDEALTRRLAAHLEGCDRCALEAATYREIKNALARRDEPDPTGVERLRGFGQSLLDDPEDADSDHVGGAAPSAGA